MSFNAIVRSIETEAKPNGASEPEVPNPLLVGQRDKDGGDRFVAALYLTPVQAAALRKLGKKHRMTIQECLSYWVDSVLSKEQKK